MFSWVVFSIVVVALFIGIFVWVSREQKPEQPDLAAELEKSEEPPDKKVASA